MATRGNPAERQREREELRQQIEEPQEEISLGMMPLLPGDVRGIFMGLKAFSKRFPEHAEGLIGRVGKMLRATPEEMEAGLKTRARNDWKPLKFEPIGKGGPLADARQRAEYGNAGNEVSLRKIRSRALPEEFEGGQRPPQGPNEARAGKAAVKATEKIITRVESAIKNAPKK